MESRKQLLCQERWRDLTKARVTVSVLGNGVGSTNVHELHFYQIIQSSNLSFAAGLGEEL